MTPSILHSNPPSRPGSPSRQHSHSSIPTRQSTLDDESSTFPFASSPTHVTGSLSGASDGWGGMNGHHNAGSGPGSSGAITPGLEHEQQLDIVLDNDQLVMRGQGSDMNPTYLTGNVELNLSSSMNLKDITMQLTCKAKVQFTDPTGGKSHHNSQVLFNHDWSFLQGDKKHNHTLKAGHHSFPFSLMLNGDLPASLSTQNHDAIIVYKLRATAIRSGLASNLHASRIFHVHRTFTQDALEFNQTLEIENTWPGKIMYAITLPFKAYAAGDDIPVLVKFMPLAKGVKVTSVTTEIHETATIQTKYSSRNASRRVTTVRHDLSSGRPELVNEEPSHPPLGWRGQTITNSRPSRPTSPAPPGDSSDEQIAQHMERGDDEVSAFLFAAVPPWTTPTHTVSPVVISHKIKWSCSISNSDGHISELRCALPVIILDNSQLTDAHAAGATTRNLLFGRAEEDAPIDLPSYSNHVYDRIAVAESSSAMYAARSGQSSLSITPPVSRPASRPSSPLPEEDEEDEHGSSARPRRQLSYRDDQELLLSLGALVSHNSSPRDTPSTSRGASRHSSRPNSRPPSPERRGSYNAAEGQHSSHTGRHSHFKIHLPAFKPLSKNSSKPILRNFSSSSLSAGGDAMRRSSSSTSVPDHSRSPHVHGSQSVPNGTQTPNLPAGASAVGGGSTSPGMGPTTRAHGRVQFANECAGHDRPNRSRQQSHASFTVTPEDESQDPLTQVPSYAIASRGFLGGGVVPLDRGLPTYDASERSTANSVVNSRRNSFVGTPASQDDLVRPMSETALVDLGDQPAQSA
ncbi:hypothetical protein BD324DRAFT_606453 [Kockovaella imperatae]|uniref:Arrestin C-terminal-like domain-containing protein n=1 Tax=Kockovaella imperatae TaxID=4999 RepID=A0A1Y1UTP8_9TREE|nr:hypothetical protein BD324DRAFT_606453 [Kockovaella imperatae]ORX40565.1 hypothetical protein BD324DRAFT_606453 [Kockovaella imperatae]